MSIDITCVCVRWTFFRSGGGVFVVQQIDRYKTKRLLINGKGKRENYRLVGILGVSDLDIT